MEARTISINGVIQRNTLLRIPYFQRRYVWGEEDWRRFAIDMESTLDSDRCYFLGAIILKEEPVTMLDRRNGIAKRQLVIDGQQRLTTLSIFMKVLHMMVGKNEDFVNQFLPEIRIFGGRVVDTLEPRIRITQIADDKESLAGRVPSGSRHVVLDEIRIDT